MNPILLTRLRFVQCADAAAKNTVTILECDDQQCASLPLCAAVLEERASNIFRLALLVNVWALCLRILTHY